MGKDKVRVCDLNPRFREALARLDGSERLPMGFVCDGCSWSPDWWPPLGPMSKILRRWFDVIVRRVPLFLACIIHDNDYRNPVEGTRAERLDADARFYRNLVAIERVMPEVFERLSRWRRMAWRIVPGFYYRRVRALGILAYTWAPNERPKRPAIWLANLVSSYKKPS